MSSYEKIMKALKGRKTGLTVPEIVEKTDLNGDTTRRALQVLIVSKAMRKCRVSGKVRTAYVAV